MPSVEVDNATPRAARAIKAAEGIAMSLKHDYVGVEHILLAVIADSGGLPRHVIDSEDPALADRLSDRLRDMMSASDFGTFADQGPLDIDGNPKNRNA